MLWSKLMVLEVWSLQQSQDWNPRPLGCESFTLTTRPRLIAYKKLIWHFLLIENRSNNVDLILLLINSFNFCCDRNWRGFLIRTHLIQLLWRSNKNKSDSNISNVILDYHRLFKRFILKNHNIFMFNNFSLNINKFLHFMFFAKVWNKTSFVTLIISFPLNNRTGSQHRKY